MRRFDGNATIFGSRLSIAAVGALMATLASFAVGVGHATAAEAPYGEVTRFGGYDQTGKIPGKFAQPVGFAVEQEDPVTKAVNRVYVLDYIRKSIQKKGGPGEGKAFLEYRLQKLTSEGAVLGSVTFTVPYTDTEHYSDAHPLYGLAVDPQAKRVYAVVESFAYETYEKEYVPVVGELIAWNTESNSKSELEGAPGYPQDGATKSGSLITGESTLLPDPTNASKDLYRPDGVAIEPKTGNVVIEAQEGIESTSAGPTVLKQISTSSGGIVSSWKDGSANPGRQGGGLFSLSSAEGSFGVQFYEGEDTIPALEIIGSELKSSERLASGTPGNNKDEAVTIGLENAPNRERAKEASALEAFAAGSPIVQLTSSAHPYAALYAHGGGPNNDPQGEVEPWAAWVDGKAPSESWMTGREGVGFDNGWAHMGVRLFETDGRVLNTLGGGEPRPQGSSELGTCSIGFARASLAAGADGAIFVLTQQNKWAIGPRKESLTTDDEVIEFAPGGRYPCPGVASERVIEGGGEEVDLKNSGPAPSIAVKAGVSTKFDAISLDRPLTWSPSWVFTWKPEPVEWVPFSFEWGWDFQKEPTAGPGKDGYTEIQKMKHDSEGDYFWPKPEAEHEYTKPGTYEARLRVYGDYGTIVFPITVIVGGGSPPKASFTPPAKLVATVLAAFDAAASTPAPGGPEIEDYHWNFGDGSQAVNTNQRIVLHRFAKPGEYEVTLTVRDNEGTQKDASVVQKVVVEPAPVLTQPVVENTVEPPPVLEKPMALSPTPTTTGVITKAASATVPKVVKKPLRRAQKLVAALKACKKLKARKRRGACEREAHRHYGSTTKWDRKRK